jgi:energy-coupling factor transport system substrate-specific component
VMHLSEAAPEHRTRILILAGIGGSIVNVITEPLIRYSFKYFILGYAQQVAYVSAINCAISMAINSVPSVIVAVILYKVLLAGPLRNYQLD